MYLLDQIRSWRLVGFYCLLCLAMDGFAIAQAQTETAAPAKKPAPSSKSASASTKAPAAKTQHAASAHTTAKHTTTHAPSHKASHKSSQTSKNLHGKKTPKKRGQQAIDPARARQIQSALIREHYMQGEPSGTWDSASQAAMQRYQADQGWQSKTTPDSRALIKLGLGPSNDHLLNPESAMTAAPAAGSPKTNAIPNPPDNNLPKQ
jgi:cytoskeletal protein RodZ